jgi:hypothetical protein
VKGRHGHATPARTGASHTAGGLTEVAQPSEDTLIITMTGVATAGPHPTQASSASMQFELDQKLGIVFASPKARQGTLTITARLVGLLRGDRHGGRSGVCEASAHLFHKDAPLMSLALEGHSVAGDDNLAINDFQGPARIRVVPGDYRLRQVFRIEAEHSWGACGTAAAAEFAPDPALDPTWISVKDPFRGANKKEFGLRMTLHVEAK